MSRLAWLFFVLPLVAAADEPRRNAGEEPSARPVAERFLRHLVAGELKEAAALSNAPERRYEVLRDYRARVGEAEFARVYRQYLESPLVAEVADGSRRLLVWRLDDAGGHLAAQYYVEHAGGFVMDDEPGAERARLRHALERLRRETASRAR